MKVHYTLTADDHIAFNKHYMQTSKEWKKIILYLRLCGGILLLTLPFSIFNKFDLTGVIITSIMGTLLLTCVPQYTKWETFRKVRKMMEDPKNQAMIGEQELTFDEETFTVKTLNAEAKYSWKSIIRLGEDENHFFLYTSTRTGYIINKSAFSDDQTLEAFKSFLAEKE